MNPSQNLKNNFYFKKILKYCSSTIRSSFEIRTKLSSFEGLDKELEDEILNYLLKIKVVYTDENYLSYYLENLSSSKGFTFNQLYPKLIKRIENRTYLKKVLSEYFKENQDEQIQRFIERNLRKISKKDPGRKRINFLLQKGFKLDLIYKYLQKYDL